MKEATAAEMRKCLELADQLKKAGIPFVPVPVFNDYDFKKVGQMAADRMKTIEDAMSQNTTISEK